MTRSADYRPAWVCPPGATVRELARKKQVSPASLAGKLGLSDSDLPRLLDGDLPMTATQAEKLATHIGASQRFWLAREAQYRQNLQLLKVESREWVSSLPFADMAKFGWLNAANSAAEKLQYAFNFFGVSSVDEWRETWLSDRAGITAYRRSPTFATQAASAAAWLRQGELAAEQLQTVSWSRENFELMLPKLKPLTRVSEPIKFLPQLQSLCASCGVAVVIIRTPKGCPASGATRVKNGQAILQLSFRYLRDDSFWFTFFHEAGHLILHGSRLFMESSGQQLDEQEEKEANDFAGRLLIPPTHEADLRRLPHEYKSIMRFARDLAVSPGIVVGQLQYRGLVRPDKLNFLKKRYSWEAC